MPSQTLPAEVDCPFCSGGLTLTVYPDTRQSTQWAACSRCEFAGDLVDLAASVWKLSVPAAVLKLASLGFSFPPERITKEGILKHLHYHPQYRARMHALRDASGGMRLLKSKQLAPLLQKMQLTSDLPPQRWQQGPGRVLGASSRDEVESALMPGSVLSAVVNGPIKNPSMHRIFVGARWDEVLMVPFQDLPGRCSGFLFAGRAGDPDKDFVYRALNLQSPMVWKEAGLAFHPLAIAEASSWEGRVLAIGDPWLMIRMIAAQYRLSLRPLPIVAWWDDGKTFTRSSYTMLHRRQTVVWGPKFDHRALRQAFECDGWLSLLDPAELESDEITGVKHLRSPETVLQMAFHAAKPWPEAFSRWLRAAERHQIEEICLQLELHGLPVDSLLERCDRMARKCVANVRSVGKGHRQTTISGRLVEERGKRWYTLHRGRRELICSASLRIRRVVHLAKQKRTYYDGEIHYEHAVVPFVDRADRIEKRTFEWMRDKLLAANAGLLQGVPAWSRRLVQIAVAFRPPQIENGPETIGWDHETQRLVTPAFSIDLHGTVKAFDFRISESLPAGQLPQPVEPSLAEIQSLCLLDSPATDVFWQVWTYVAARVLAPAVGLDEPGASVEGDQAFQVARTAAGLLGCLEATLKPRGPLPAELDPETRHSWPVIVRQAKNAPDQELTNCLTRQDRMRALLSTLLGGWFPISVDPGIELGELPEELLDLAPQAFAAYLADALYRGLQVGGVLSDQDWERRIAEDTAAWLRRLGGEPKTLEQAAARMPRRTGEERANLLAEVICERYLEGDVELVVEGFAGCGGRSLEKLGRNRLLIPYALVTETLARFETVQITDVAKILEEGGKLLGEREEGPQPGWIVPAKWLTSLLHARRTKPSLKVSG